MLSIPVQGRIALSPLVFASGHATELYLKSAVTAHDSLEKAVKFGHKMRDLWQRCEGYSGFPLKNLVDVSLLDQRTDIYSTEARRELPEKQRIHLAENESLYLAIRHVQDLKYLGINGPTLKGDYKLTFGLGLPDRTMIGHLTVLARWCWGQWANRGGYNDPSLYDLAAKLASGNIKLSL